MKRPERCLLQIADAAPVPAPRSSLLRPSHPRAVFRNWARTFVCHPRAVFVPEDEQQCRQIVELARREHTTVRACGAGHSPSDLACTSGFLIRTDKLSRVLEVNAAERYVVVEAGISLHALHAVLGRHGLAMSNVGSISDQSLAGVVTTATHGSGIDYAVIPAHVLALELLLADGSKVRCDRAARPDLFLATLSGLGQTGLVLTVTLRVEPAFRLREVRRVLAFDDVVAQLDAIAHSAQHVRLWWFPHQHRCRVMAADRSDQAPNATPSWFWDTVVGFHLVQLLLFAGRFWTCLTALASALACWLASPPQIVVDDSHRVFNLDCRYPQYTVEWAIPYDQTQSCLREMQGWLDKELEDPNGIRPHFPVEIRFTKPDDIWLSPSYGQHTTWIGLVQYKPYNFTVPYRHYFRDFAAIVMRHGGRPHWAKEHTLRATDLRRLYPRFDAFLELVGRVDPHGIFRNEYIRRHFFDDSSVCARVFKDRR